MKKIILYARGKDKPGIISRISKEINSLNGNIEISKMIKLETYFNILSLIEIKESDINNLVNKLNEIDDLSIEISNIKNTTKKHNNIFFFSRPEISKIFLIWCFVQTMKMFPFFSSKDCA